MLTEYGSDAGVAPLRARGLKHDVASSIGGSLGRAFTGAWIETHNLQVVQFHTEVAPLRARGLKRQSTQHEISGFCRAFTGAWIETQINQRNVTQVTVAPLRARGLKLASPRLQAQVRSSRLYGRVD